MSFTSEERRLLSLYYSGTVAETVGTLFLALRDMTDHDERATIHSILSKIEYLGEEAEYKLSEGGIAHG